MFIIIMDLLIIPAYSEKGKKSFDVLTGDKELEFHTATDRTKTD